MNNAHWIAVGDQRIKRDAVVAYTKRSESQVCVYLGGGGTLVFDMTFEQWEELLFGATKLGFIFKEYIGLDVCSLAGLVLREASDIYEGRQVLAGFWKGVVKKRANGEYYVDGPCWMYQLEYAKDDRNCWVCGGLINKALLGADT